MVASVIGLLSSIVGILIGSLVTFIVAKHYYEKASKELVEESVKLHDETQRLRKFNVLLLRAFENAGLAEFTRDENGEPVGLVFHETIIESFSLTDTVCATSTPPSDL